MTSVPKLFEKVCDDYEQNNKYNGQYPEFSEVKSQLFRHRTESLPPLPDDVTDVDFNTIDPIWRRTKRGTLFMRKHDPNHGITIFCTEEQLQLLSEVRFLVADGTFKTAPEPYEQIYSFHGIVGNRRIPLLWALMKMFYKQVAFVTFLSSFL